MNNLTKYGKSYLSKHLQNYAAGKLRFSEVLAILDICFEQRLNVD